MKVSKINSNINSSPSHEIIKPISIKLQKNNIFETINNYFPDNITLPESLSEEEKELSQCTFKPKLYTNKYNNRIQSQKKIDKTKSIYEKNSIWSNKLKEKKEKERKITMN